MIGNCSSFPTEMWNSSRLYPRTPPHVRVKFTLAAVSGIPVSAPSLPESTQREGGSPGLETGRLRGTGPGGQRGTGTGVLQDADKTRTLACISARLQVCRRAWVLLWNMARALEYYASRYCLAWTWTLTRQRTSKARKMWTKRRWRRQRWARTMLLRLPPPCLTMVQSSSGEALFFNVIGSF